MKKGIEVRARHGVVVRRRVAVTVATLVVLSATALGAAEPMREGSASTNDASVDPASWPVLKGALEADGALEERVRSLLAKMSIEEKVGQIVQGDIGSVTPADVRKYRLGSVLAGGNSDPGGNYKATADDWVALADEFHAASIDTSGGHNAIPLLFGIDAVHGHNNLVGATLFPHNIGLGATRNPELMREIAAATAVELRATGLDWTFAPTLAVPRDDRWGRTYEGYSEDPELVASYARPLVEGLQGRASASDFLGPRRVIATAKHFIGDGGTEEGRDQGDARVSEQVLREVHGAGYPPALEAGAQAVMASFSSWNGAKIHGHHGLLTEVLKERMGFDGFVVGDWNAHGQLDGCSNTDCAAAFNAGIDMLMAPDSWKGYYESALRQVRSGEIPMARLDDAVTRILRVKMRAGLFEANKPSMRALSGDQDLLGAAPHREIARRAVRESLVLLKNDGGVLPLDPRSTILVAGDGADDIGKQSGGWTLTWQGTGLKPSDFPNAQSIWAGLREQIRAAGGTALLASDGSYDAKPDAAVVVFGEDPYAEFQGDIKTVAYKPTNDADLALLKKLSDDGIPVVAVFLSGRPLWMNRELNASDAFVAAWLPGSEGGGVADVLLRTAEGSVAHDFKGRLSYSWPRNAAQTPLNVGDDDYSPLFAYGYGLSYSDSSRVGTLDEDPRVDLTASQSDRFFDRGALANGWRMRIRSAAQNDAFLQTVSDASGASVVVSGVDYRAQEDAWRVSWKDNASIAFVPAETLDLNRETNGDVLLLMTVRPEAGLADDAFLIAEDIGGTQSRVRLGGQLAALPADTWTRVGIALKCVQAAGANMAALAVPVAIEAGAGSVLSIHEVGYGTDADIVLTCPPG